MTDIVNILRSIDTITSAAKLIRESLKNIDFGLQDKFCNSEELKQSWQNTKIPDEVIAFFSELFNIKKTTLLKSYNKEKEEIGDSPVELDNEELDYDKTNDFDI